MGVLIVGTIAIMAPLTFGDLGGTWGSIGLRIGMVAVFVVVFLYASRRSERQQTWREVDQFLASHLTGADETLDQVVEQSVRGGLPEIQVSRMQGAFLGMLVGAIRARRVLEIGTLGGYSAICMARQLPPDGTLVSLELDPHHAKVASENLALAGFGPDAPGKAAVRIIVGPAIETLPDLADKEPFDLVFIDADKASMPDYFDWACRLTRPGGVIVCDNVVRGGGVLRTDDADANIVGVRNLLRTAGIDDRVEGAALQTVGEKGYDGFAIFRVKRTSSV